MYAQLLSNSVREPGHIKLCMHDFNRHAVQKCLQGHYPDNVTVVDTTFTVPTRGSVFSEEVQTSLPYVQVINDLCGLEDVQNVYGLNMTHVVLTAVRTLP